MSKFNTYEPEDIEQLMLEKSFEELLDKEKAFVLKHVDGIAEYDEMRKILLSIKENAPDDEVIEPPSYMRKQLLDDFIARQRKNPFIIFIQQLKDLFKRPSFQIGLASFGILIFAFIVFRFHDFNADSKQQLAINEKNKSREFPTTTKDLESLPEESTPDEPSLMEREPTTLKEGNDFSSIDMTIQIREEVTDERAVPQSPVLDLQDDILFSSKDKNDRTKNEIAVQDQESTAMEDERIYDNTVYPSSRSGNRKATSNAVGGMNITQKGSTLEENKEIFFNIMYAAN